MLEDEARLWDVAESFQPEIIVRLAAQAGGIDAPPARPASKDEIAEADNLSPVAPFRIVNIGNSDKVRLLDFVYAIEDELGIKAIRNYMPMQPGDVPATWADASLLQRLTGYRPQTDFRDGTSNSSPDSATTIRNRADMTCEQEWLGGVKIAVIGPGYVGLPLIAAPSEDSCEAILVAVGHQQLRELGADAIRKWGRADHGLYDIKYPFEAEQADLQSE